MKVCAICGSEDIGGDAETVCRSCEEGKTKNRRAKRREVHEIMTMLGLTRVKGALGGVYYE